MSSVDQEQETSFTAVVIIVLLIALGFASHILEIYNFVESLAEQLYPLSYVAAIVTYSISFILYVWQSASLETFDPQPPIGLIGSKGAGPPIALLGEFIQVMAFIQSSRLIIHGIHLGEWDANLSFMNYLLMVVIGVGFLAASYASILIRIYSVSKLWPTQYTII